ncbi:uncharacterized protein BP01DRAFT_427351 [Aspergillus saccharolyticus JOP 1030-1]|uniref:Zn(2)-C6 fungal-type domain-containing protein n=1 Tax=Aspergillus saccharolyticus JOP 1030-1 TaxID=1450539 RepID=A0A318Z5G0_9EURO|nr:hypothetical protein BP01DRAFT_427351 [Aspergillus saccharolyticus JOP 1030-1]PYH40053.1 hypothetical protein BP01DRAFT_427351 [Aspergillus saccharolyticus JOP 1030-1]
MVKKAGLRRSCTFCRARKIACSGEPICAACRERSRECVYDLESAKGRPRLDKTFPSIPAESASNASTTISIVAELDVMFREDFSDDTMAPFSPNLFQDRVATFNRHLVMGDDKGNDSNREPSSSSSTPAAAGCISYDGFLALVMQELIETTALKFSNLGCHPFFGPGERYYRASMLQDTTKTMFDSPASSLSPSADPDFLTEYSPHLITQYLEVWFSNHPLSILVSKSLLLRDLRGHKANRILLAILLADAHQFADESAKGDRLVQWAISQLSSIPAGKGDLTTAQSLLLLGWYHACRGHARRAICYVGYAGRILVKLKCQLYESSLSGQAHINGIDLGIVEAELIHNACWVMLALVLWSFIQMDMPLLDLLPGRLLQVLPASSESESMLLRLDRASGNLSSLKPQLSSLQSVWLLAHITSLSAHLYALYPQPTRAPPAPQPWQELILYRLDRLMHQGRSLAQICADAREALLDVVTIAQHDFVDGRDGPAPTLLVFHQAVLLHLLFPRGETNCHAPHTCSLNESLFQQLTTSIHDLVKLFPAIQIATRQPLTQPASIGFTSLHLYVLSLDAASRALLYVLTLWDRATTVEQQIWQDRLPRLLEGGLKMYALFDHDTLLQDHRWRAVKRFLKTACSRLEGAIAGSPDQSSHSSSSFSTGLDFNLPTQLTAAADICSIEMVPSSTLLQVSHDAGFEWPDGQDLATPQRPPENSQAVTSELPALDLASLSTPMPLLSLGLSNSISQISDSQTCCMIQQSSQKPISVTSFWDQSILSLAHQHHLVDTVPELSSNSPADPGMAEQRRQRKRSSTSTGGLDEVRDIEHDH